ncbi:hypothetical protein LP419_26360 [Massilia sp. H-1]|nr:hypothetical protein LP419_26360 [Massilia sp. H-1]
MAAPCRCARPVANTVGNNRLLDIGGRFGQRLFAEHELGVRVQAQVGLVAFQRTLDIARHEQREGVDNARILIDFGAVVPVRLAQIMAPEFGRRPVHVQHHHAVAIVVVLLRAAEVMHFAGWQAVRVLLRRLVVIPPWRIADEEDLQHGEAVDRVKVAGNMFRQVRGELDQRHARQRQDQARRFDLDRAILGAHVQFQRRLAQSDGAEAAQRMAAYQRDVRLRMDLGHQRVGQAGRAALDAGQFLAHGLERAATR